MRDVLCLQPLRPAQQAEMERLWRVHRHSPDAVPDDVAARVEAVVTDGHVGLGRALIDRLPRLTLVACGSAGTEGIDGAALAGRGVPLTTVSAALAEEVADLALMLMLAAWAGLGRLDRHVRSGAWGREGPAPLGRSLGGRRLGLLGIGAIGQAVAARARPLGLEVAYHARHPRDLPLRFEPDLLALARDSDILVVAIPGGDATRGMVSRAVIEALGQGASRGGCLVNVARGSVVDEPALIEALRDGRLGSAGLDVFAREPDPDPALLALDSVVLTPHHGSATVETRDAMSRSVLDSLAAHLAHSA